MSTLDEPLLQVSPHKLLNRRDSCKDAMNQACFFTFFPRTRNLIEQCFKDPLSPLWLSVARRNKIHTCKIAPMGHAQSRQPKMHFFHWRFFQSCFLLASSIQCPIHSCSHRKKRIHTNANTPIGFLDRHWFNGLYRRDLRLQSQLNQPLFTGLPRKARQSTSTLLAPHVTGPSCSTNLGGLLLAGAKSSALEGCRFFLFHLTPRVRV